MRGPAWALGLGLLLVALAGCSDGGDGDPGPGGNGGGDDGSSSPDPSSQEFQFALDPAVGLPVGGGLLPVGDDDRIPFEVPAGYTHLDATASWTCGTGALCELDLELRYGESDLVTSDFGASPVTLSVDDPPPGRWTFWAFPSGDGSLAIGLQGTLTVELS